MFLVFSENALLFFVCFSAETAAQDEASALESLKAQIADNLGLGAAGADARADLEGERHRGTRPPM